MATTYVLLEDFTPTQVRDVLAYVQRIENNNEKKESQND